MNNIKNEVKILNSWLKIYSLVGAEKEHLNKAIAAHVDLLGGEDDEKKCHLSRVKKRLKNAEILDMSGRNEFIRRIKNRLGKINAQHGFLKASA